MHWVLNEYDERKHISIISQENAKQHSFYTPCCHSIAVYVKPQNNTPFFRHPPHSSCQFSKQSEYNLGLHWEIVQYIDDFVDSNRNWWSLFRLHRFFPSYFQIQSFFKKAAMKHEELIHYKEHHKRIDLLVGKYALEVQCSAIKTEEIELRESIYSNLGYKIVWILGLSEERTGIEKIHLPQSAPRNIQKSMEKFIYNLYLKKKIQKKLTKQMYILKGFRLTKWQYEILSSYRVLGFYWNGHLYPDFQFFVIYEHLPLHINPIGVKKTFFATINTKNFL